MVPTLRGWPVTWVRAREQGRERQRPLCPDLGCGRARKGPTSAGARWYSGCSAPGPAEAPAAGLGRQVPCPSLDALLGVRLVAAVRLLDGLPADPECSPDLCPRRSVSTCCRGQQIACIGQGVLGVSHRFQGLQGPLWATPDALQVLDHPADLPTRERRLFGAHVNGYCRRPPTADGRESSISVDRSIWDATFLNSSTVRVGALRLSISAVRYRATTEKKDPALRQQPGSWTTSGATDDDNSSLRS